MLTRFICFLLLFCFVFLFISHLSDLLLSLWIAQSPTLSSQLEKLTLFNVGLHQLKFILGLRGIHYIKNSIDDDKTQHETLIELVKGSGQITRDELIQLESSSENCDTQRVGELKVFSSAKLMEEEIDDGHVWLLHLEQENCRGGCNHVWPKLMQRFGKFNFRFARFDCGADMAYCHRKRWFASNVVLVFPRTHSEYTSNRKKVFSHPLDSQTHVNEITHWLQQHLTSQLIFIENIDDLEQNWLNPSQTSKPKNLVKMVTIMGNEFHRTPPLILALLALQFRDRIQFGIHFASKNDLTELHSRFRTQISTKLPIYLIAHPQHKMIVYNEKHYEPLSYSQMDIYLRGLSPEMNDIYLGLLSIINLCLGLNCFWTRCMTAHKHLRLCLIKTLEINFTCILAPLLAIRVFALLSLFLPQSLISILNVQTISLFQTFWSSRLAFYFRFQFLSTFGFELFILSFIATGLILVTIRRNRFLQSRIFSDYDDELFKNVFHWVSAIGCFVGIILFRNTSHHIRRRVVTRPHPQQEDQLNNNVQTPAALEESNSNNNDEIYEEYEEDDEEIELSDYIDVDSDLDRFLLESLFTMPNLWLQPELISSDYMYQLPLWQHTQVLVSNIAETANESSNSSTSDLSDNEELYFLASSQPSTSNETDRAEWIKAIDCCKSTKEAPEAASCSGQPNVESCSSKCAKQTVSSDLSPLLKAKLEKRQKIIRIKRQRKRVLTSVETEGKKKIDFKHQQNQLETDRPAWMLDFNDCTICLDAYKVSQTICGLPCGHNYHHECIQQWLVRGNHCCPICRWPSYRLKHPRQTQVNCK